MGKKINFKIVKLLKYTLLYVVTFVVSTVFTQANAQIALPDLGDSSESILSVHKERQIGAYFMAQLRRETEVMDDVDVQHYITQLGNKILRAGNTPSFKYTFFVVKDNLINAFAAPGGYVGFNSGTIIASEFESEVAGVAAHEISHVEQRHIARRLEYNEQSSLASIVGLLAAVAIGTQNAAAGQAAATAALGIPIQNKLGFARSAEREADRLGMYLLYSAGFDPSGMSNFFEKLASSGRYYSAPPEFLLTHPVTSERIAESRSHSKQLGYRQHANSLEYELVRAKLRVLGVEKFKLLEEQFQNRLKTGTQQQRLSSEYGIALIYQRKEKHSEALKIFKKLHKQNKNNVALTLAVAKSALLAGNTKDAMLRFSAANNRFFDDERVLILYSGALVDHNQAEKALNLIENYAQSNTLDHRLHKIRANAYAEIGKDAQSHAALADYYSNIGDFSGALDQIRRAIKLNQGGDYYLTEKYEARRQELQNRLN